MTPGSLLSREEDYRRRWVSVGKGNESHRENDAFGGLRSEGCMWTQDEGDKWTRDGEGK